MSEQDTVFYYTVNVLIPSLVTGFNACVDEVKPISYGKQLVVRYIDESDPNDVVYINVYNSKKGVRSMIQGNDSSLLSLVKENIPTGYIDRFTINEITPLFK